MKRMRSSKAAAPAKNSGNNIRPYVHPRALVESGDIGFGTRIWAFAHVMKGAVIGRDCNVGDHAFIESDVTIGDRVTIKNGVSVWQGVTLEEDVFVGPNAAFTNDRFPVSRCANYRMEQTHVKRGAAVGANATVVCGVTIGEYAMVGAGSVVTRDVPAHTLVYGNPAKPADFLCVCRQKIRFGSGSARCACGERYRKTRKGIERV
jgi:UDP-2-acetamido-3-amino-2,3-dideoxy-glucuronate N-acetyltransferase